MIKLLRFFQLKWYNLTNICHGQKESWFSGMIPWMLLPGGLERWYNIDVEVNVRLSRGSSDSVPLLSMMILRRFLNLLKRSLADRLQNLNGNLKPDETHSKKKVILFPRTNEY